tara:strand:- start:205 stop:453 length:249 start_codon:yes stop_codon:yes gene_type:complete
MNNDTHDKLMQKVLDYLAASEDFERLPSERSKRRVRRELRQLMSLCKTRQEEVKERYAVELAEIRASGKWADNKRKAKRNEE